MDKELLQAIEQAAQSGRLDLSGKQLTSFPLEVLQLQTLKWLDLSENKLSSLPSAVRHLKSLTQLNLSSNYLAQLPQEIGQLRNLTDLNLENNQLTELPATITRIQSLTWLNLNNNQLRSLSIDIGKLRNLIDLRLRDNQLVEVPTTVIRLRSLAYLDLTGNQLELPVQIVVQVQQPKIILSYIKQLQKEKEEYAFEAKLLILGESGVGKTALIKKIQNEKYQLQDEKPTVGIDITQWSYTKDNRQFRINIWDFGGQEINYATQEFFFTNQSLYILVADPREGNENFYSLLNTIEKRSNNSPVIIIKNQRQNRQVEVDESKLRGRFSNLRILSINLADNNGLSEAITEIKHQIDQLPHIAKPSRIPKNWIDIKEALKQHPQNYIKEEEFSKLCQKCGLTGKEDIRQLSRYLHQLGVCLHFEDNIYLERIIILRGCFKSFSGSNFTPIA